MSKQLPAVPVYCDNVTPQQYADAAERYTKGDSACTVNDEIACKALMALQNPIPLRLAILFRYKLDNAWGDGKPYRPRAMQPNPNAARDQAAKRAYEKRMAEQRNTFPDEPRSYEEAVARWPLGPVQSEFRAWCNRNQAKLRT